MSLKGVYKQLENKVGKKIKFKKHNFPKNRKYGKIRRKCRRCGRRGRGIVRKYNLYFCRQCMREIAYKLGFRKYS